MKVKDQRFENNLRLSILADESNESKICKKCLNDKLLKEFPTHPSCKGGKKPICKACFYRSDSRRFNQLRYRRTIEGQEADRKYRMSLLRRKSLQRYNRSIKGKALHSRKNAKRRANLLQAIPKWLSIEAIEKINSIYLECAKLNKLYGDRLYHVDHIIPLKGKNISGLHVPENLRVIEAKENNKKSNKWENTLT